MAALKQVIGKRFGRLLVLSDTKKFNSNNNRSYRELYCKCDCGNKCYVRKEKVLKGDTKSCGCMQKEMRASLGMKKRLSYGEASANERFCAYRKGARRRNLEFSLTKEQFMDIVLKPCIYCGAERTSIYRSNNPRRFGNFRYTGIDRYDHTKGYTIDNCVPCCTKCNRIKWDMDADEMLSQLEKILANKERWHRTA